MLLASLICNVPIFLDGITVDVYADPIKLFGVEVKAVQVLNSFVFFNLCWRKSEKILHFANFSSSNFLCGSKRKFSYGFISILPLLLDVLLMDQFWDYVSFSAQGDWNLYLYEIATLVGYVASVLLTNFIDTFITILALSGYNMVRKCSASLEELKKWDVAQKQWKQGDFSCLIDIAKKLQHFFTTLNSLGSSVILNWFCMCVPWVSYKLVGGFPGSGTELVGESVLTLLTTVDKQVIGLIYYWSFIGLYLGIMVLCSEIRRECDNIKREMKRIILQYDPKLRKGKAALCHVEHALENVGIHGGFFFNFSYSFLGSAAGLIVAYAFLALQLRLNCCGSENLDIRRPLII
ncbi:unnamed protein product [Orchesella dallaii]|uniref:Gustatory receptor n=1 Tax=Orchesella dallaii TaxID=48710 RepID=A0ABP1R3Z2_9HEXA